MGDEGQDDLCAEGFSQYLKENVFIEENIVQWMKQRKIYFNILSRFIIVNV